MAKSDMLPRSVTYGTMLEVGCHEFCGYFLADPECSAKLSGISGMIPGELAVSLGSRFWSLQVIAIEYVEEGSESMQQHMWV